MNMISAGRKTWCQRIKAAIILEGVILLMAAFILWENTAGTGGKTVTATSDGTIRWVDFNVSYEALCKAYECDVDTYGSEMHIDWIDLLSYVAAKNGGEFGATAVSELNEAAEKVKRYDNEVLVECGLKEGQKLAFPEFTEAVQKKIIETGKRTKICGDCQWNRICQEQPSRWSK